MGWAVGHILRLTRGETVSFRPRGNSMSPKIKSGQLVTVEPVRADTPLVVGDVVLCRVGGCEFLHLVKAIENDGKTFAIGNIHDFLNGRIPRDKIYGRLTKVEP